MSTAFRQGKLNKDVLLFTVFHKQTCIQSTLEVLQKAEDLNLVTSPPCTLTPKACKQNKFCLQEFFLSFTSIIEKENMFSGNI